MLQLFISHCSCPQIMTSPILENCLLVPLGNYVLTYKGGTRWQQIFTKALHIVCISIDSSRLPIMGRPDSRPDRQERNVGFCAFQAKRKESGRFSTAWMKVLIIASAWRGVLAQSIRLFKLYDLPNEFTKKEIAARQLLRNNNTRTDFPPLFQNLDTCLDNQCRQRRRHVCKFL